MEYALEERVPDVDSKSLVSVCNDVCSTPIQLNHGVILSLQITVRNVFSRLLAFVTLVSFRERERKAGGGGRGEPWARERTKRKIPSPSLPSLYVYFLFLRRLALQDICNFEPKDKI